MGAVVPVAVPWQCDLGVCVSLVRVPVLSWTLLATGRDLRLGRVTSCFLLLCRKTEQRLISNGPP